MLFGTGNQITSPSLCEALGVSTKTGYKLLKDGKIECLKIGRAYRIPKAYILRYLQISGNATAE